MIDELLVNDIALIREASLRPAPGLTAITGETGAGKTALLGALKLLAGERGDASVVREGAPSLSVQARLFFRDASAFGLECDAQEGVVVERSVSADGRSRVHVDGAISQVGKLAQTVGASIDLCGQHEHQRLLKPANHAAMLDSWIGQEARELLAAYASAYAQVQAARAEMSRIEDAQRMSAEQVDQARYVLRRIQEVDPIEGEYEELCASLPKVENAEALMRSIEGTCEALSGDGGVLDGVGSAISLLQSASAIDPDLAPLAQSLVEASYVLEDVTREAQSYRMGIDFDESDLASMQERMSLLQGLMRSWGPTMDEVLAARDEAEATVSAVEGFDEQMQAATRCLEEALDELRRAGDAVHGLRVTHASAFAREVSGQMARLELRGASLECSVEPREFQSWGPSGPDDVEFMFRPGSNLTARPLAKIASGGEVSRVMLAIKVVLGKSDAVETLVFDEVDAGIGGTAARALSEVIAQLAQTHQVIVVTHLAQVAAPAQVHYIARKTGEDDPQTSFTQVEGEDRVVEIARMLSGDASEASIAHARQLLEES